MHATNEGRLEGQFTAHRKILSRLLAALATGQDPAELMEYLRQRQVMQDHQEDPGAVPSGAVAILAAEAEEMRLILEAVRALAPDAG